MVRLWWHWGHLNRAVKARTLTLTHSDILEISANNYFHPEQLRYSPRKLYKSGMRFAPLFCQASMKWFVVWRITCIFIIFFCLTCILHSSSLHVWRLIFCSQYFSCVLGFLRVISLIVTLRCLFTIHIVELYSLSDGSVHIFYESSSHGQNLCLPCCWKHFLLIY